MALVWMKQTATNYHEAWRLIMGFLRNSAGWKMTAFARQTANGAGAPGIWTWDGVSNDNTPFNAFNVGGHVFDNTRTWWTMRSPGDPFPTLGPVGSFEFQFAKQNDGATWGRNCWVRFNRGGASFGNPAVYYAYGANNQNGAAYIGPPADVSHNHHMHGNSHDDGRAVFERDNNFQLRLVGYADTAPPYKFVTFGYILGGSGNGKCVHMWIYDPYIPGTYIDTGVAATSDHDPYTIMIGASTGSTGDGDDPVDEYNGGFSDQNQVRGTKQSYQRNPLDGTITPVNLTCYFAPNTGPNPFTGKDDLFNIAFGRDRGQGIVCGWKGVGNTIKQLSTIRNSGDNLTVNTTRDWVIVRAFSGNCYAMPWDFATLGVPDV